MRTVSRMVPSKSRYGFPAAALAEPGSAAAGFLGSSFRSWVVSNESFRRGAGEEALGIGDMELGCISFKSCAICGASGPEGRRFGAPVAGSDSGVGADAGDLR